LKADAFAYFALSIVWRAAVHEWALPDGSRTAPLDLGPKQESIRLYLLERAGFPDAIVTVTVCTDSFSRQHWVTPMVSLDPPCRSFPFIALGVVFRVWVGPGIPRRLRELCCRTEPQHPILSTFCDDQTARVLSGLAPLPSDS
jgi:hypothetical protein